MTDIQKKISDLQYSLSILEFKDRWDSDDYKLHDELCKQIKELKEQLAPSGYYVILKFDWDKDGITYFTGDPILTCSDEPTYFESEDEALRLLKASQVSSTPYEIRKVGE